MAGAPPPAAQSAAHDAAALDAIFSTARVGLCLLDERDRVLRATPQWLRPTGRTLAEAAGQEVWALVPGYPPELRDLHEEVRRGRVVDVPMRRQPLDGEDRWYQGRLSPVPLRTGVGILITVQDVTAFERAEVELAEKVEALRRSEAAYELLAAHATDIVWTYDLRACRMSYVSPAVERVRGISVAEAMEEPLQARFMPESMERVTQLLSAVGEPGCPDTFTGIFDQPGRDRAVKHMELSVRLVRDEAGQPLELVGVSRDATRRVEAERLLRDSEARFRALTERSSDMICVLDGELRVRFWSASATEGLGWPAEEVLGRPILDVGVIHPDDVCLAREALDAAMASDGGTALAVTRDRHKDGRWLLVETKLRNLFGDAAVRGLVLNARDITAQHELEEELHQAQRLESLGRLAGGVAHDFNNLLTVVLGCAAALREDATEGRPASLEDVEALETAAERGRDLNRQLLGFARRQVMQPVVLDPAVQMGIDERIASRMLGEAYRLKVEVEPGAWPVRFDPAQLDQVLLNLVANARDAMPEGGEIGVSVQNREAPAPGEPAGAPPRPWVVFSVRDHGPGFSPEARAHLFEPFFTTKPHGRGTGLGLATVHGIVHQNRGHVRVEGAPGGGTLVEIHLPRVSSDAPPRAPRDAAAVAARGHGTVLAVEDDALVRAITVRALRGAGYEVLVAEDGHHAVELARGHGPGIDLLVTDVVMPGMSGKEVADALRAHRPGLPVLYVSGYPRDTIARRGVLLDGVELLAKPFSPEALVQRVAALLAGAGVRRA